MPIKIENIISIVINKTKANKFIGLELIQNLWSDYGQLYRCYLDNSSVILKLINADNRLTYDQDQDSNLGHLRKKTSYKVEAYWYQKYNTPINGALRPKLIASGLYQNYQYLILEDLKNMGFHPKLSPSQNEIQNCLSWLAHFHSFFLGHEGRGLWPIGTYWHLDTRPQELNAMKDLELKKAAPLIDSKLNKAKFKTLVHGDSKLANFLFSLDTAAAVDFQYIGGGVGIKDVAYFLSSVYKEDDLNKFASNDLDFYFKQLNNPEVENEWRELYPFAWCDFYRFLQGWSPTHAKINSYIKKMKERVLKCL